MQRSATAETASLDQSNLPNYNTPDVNMGLACRPQKITNNQHSHLTCLHMFMHHHHPITTWQTCSDSCLLAVMAQGCTCILPQVASTLHMGSFPHP